MNYKMIFDYHTHTTYSHGKGSIEDNVKVAIEKGLKAIAITDHGPGHLTYGIKRSAVAEMREEIERLKKKYPEIEIYLGVEANTVDNGNYLDVTPEEYAQYDFVNAGYHFGVKNCYVIKNFLTKHGVFRNKEKISELREKNTDMIIKAIENNHIKILTHPGDKAPVNMERLAKACAKHGVLMEISTHHRHLTVDEIKICAKEDVKFVISSDAHTPEKVGTFQGGIDRAIKAGLDLDRIVNIQKVD